MSEYGHIKIAPFVCVEGFKNNVLVQLISPGRRHVAYTSILRVKVAALVCLLYFLYFTFIHIILINQFLAVPYNILEHLRPPNTETSTTILQKPVAEPFQSLAKYIVGTYCIYSVSTTLGKKQGGLIERGFRRCTKFSLHTAVSKK